MAFRAQKVFGTFEKCAPAMNLYGNRSHTEPATLQQ